MGLDGVELVIRFEEEFGIVIPDSAAERMFTPSDVVSFVTDQLHTSGSAITRAQVADRVRQIVLDQTGIAEAVYSEEKRFIEDFGID